MVPSVTHAPWWPPAVPMVCQQGELPLLITRAQPSVLLLVRREQSWGFLFPHYDFPLRLAASTLGENKMRFPWGPLRHPLDHPSNQEKRPPAARLG